MWGMRTLFAITLAGSLFTQAPAAPLHIVVIEGEGAVNIIQQKTAVRPLVEVRDRNNVPVPGATVTFTIGSGQPAAFAGGAPAMTATTNASGQAAATGFNAVRSGLVQIQVQAAHQGQAAAAVITQTNFATAAAAAAAGVAVGAASGGAAGTAGGATAAAAGTTGGAAAGGISATTIAIIGGAVGGGAVVATQVTKKGGDDPDAFDGYKGSFSGSFVFVNSGPASTCTFNRTMSGNLTIDLKQNGTGTARLSGTMTGTSASGTCIPEGSRGFSVPDGAVTGGPSAITFTTSNNDLPQTKATFNGSLSGSTITGQLTIEETTQTSTGGQTFTGRGTGTATVTLTR